MAAWASEGGALNLPDEGVAELAKLFHSQQAAQQRCNAEVSPRFQAGWHYAHPVQCTDE